MTLNTHYRMYARESRAGVMHRQQWQVNIETILGAHHYVQMKTVNFTIRYDSVYLTCSKKLTGSQLSPPHGTNKKIKM